MYKNLLQQKNYNNYTYIISINFFMIDLQNYMNLNNDYKTL